MLSVAAGDSVGLVAPYYATTQIVVNGTVTAASTSFYTYGSNSGQFTLLQVNSGGELIANNTSFSLSQLSLANGNAVQQGDLTGDTFNLPIYAPALDVPLLAGTDLKANQSFQDVDILGGSLNSGQSLSLGLMGSASTAHLRYIFSGGFTVQPNAELTSRPTSRS